MHCLLRVLMLVFLLLSPCVLGCSSQMSVEDAERLEAESDDTEDMAEEDLDVQDDEI